jgi:hypothetical protein
MVFASSYLISSGEEASSFEHDIPEIITIKHIKNIRVLEKTVFMIFDLGCSNIRLFIVTCISAVILTFYR